MTRLMNIFTPQNKVQFLQCELTKDGVQKNGEPLLEET